MKRIALVGLLFVANFGFSQTTFPVNGVYEKDNPTYAFIGATIYQDHNNIIHNGVMLVKNGLIQDIGQNIKVPKAAVQVDFNGLYIYPSFIDAYTEYGQPEIKPRKMVHGPKIESGKHGAFSWNEAIHPEISGAMSFRYNKKQSEELRKLGFGAVLSVPNDGIVMGSSALVLLGNGKEHELILKSDAAATYSFSKGKSIQDYPSSLMGSIALLRQSYLDAEWYSSNTNKDEINLSLAAWNDLTDLPQIFDAGDKLTVLRADKVGDEFGVQYIIVDGGDGYQRIKEMKNTGASFILPINFPKAYEVKDAFDARRVSLKKMKHWELAPSNPAIFETNSIDFSISTIALKDKTEFWKQLRKSIEHGLSEDKALEALTITPAKMLGVEKRAGSLEKGKLANFLVASGKLFDDGTEIYENWIKGEKYELRKWTNLNFSGKYTMNFEGFKNNLLLDGSNNKYTAKIILSDSSAKKDSELDYEIDTIKATVKISDNLISLRFNLNGEEISLSGATIGKSWNGSGTISDGRWVTWTAKHMGPLDQDTTKIKDNKDNKKTVNGKIYYPNMAYGWTEKPEPQAILIRGATVWTNEEEGVLNGADVLIESGKIVKVGVEIKVAEGVKIIDGTDLHLTTGIIDEHSHIAISGGVNESGQAVSAEVSISDVIRSDDINIYRQLAGGVTAAQLLHGSANPIGGQSGIIKFRWGSSPEEMKIKNADGFIKFALGENVKQSNWGDRMTIRYPQTRMGVEQIFYDSFIRAKEYDIAWRTYNTLSKKQKISALKPRKDLELETLVEILNLKRFITCHSYVQSEINMLMHVADSMGFRINTFTHILEGYKVADKMKSHGVGASTFSDWWAYKFEVRDAIPYNGAILNEMGIVTAYNSDDAEMARRLNQEAAKAVMYGGVSQEDALKMVTLNPAKLLHLDDRMGSIKIGKDADLVLWTDNPLSVYAKVYQTYVDGICLYDSKRDKEMRIEIANERSRLIQKMLDAKGGGEKTQRPKKDKEELYNCGENHEGL